MSRKWFFVSQCLVACILILVLLISPLDAPGTRAWSGDPTENTAICTAPDDQRNAAIASDGSGGAIIAWEDYRSGTDYDIYAQRVDSMGIPQWAADGVSICTASDNQERPVIASDGSGGAIITWRDYRSGAYDIYAQRLDSTGTPAGLQTGLPSATHQISHTIPSR